MQPHARNSYLEAEVMTAAPQKLRLMLIEAALRQGARAKEAWSQGADEAAGEALIRGQEIVGELISGIDPERASDLSRRVAAIYNFVARAMIEAHVRKNAKSLDEAMRILEEERQTWRLVCEQLGTRRVDTSANIVEPHANVGSLSALEA